MDRDRTRMAAVMTVCVSCIKTSVDEGTALITRQLTKHAALLHTHQQHNVREWAVVHPTPALLRRHWGLTPPEMKAMLTQIAMTATCSNKDLLVLVWATREAKRRMP